MLLCAACLTACATVPNVQSAPRLPALEVVPKDALEQPFIDQIQSFLSGLPSVQTESDSH